MQKVKKIIGYNEETGEPIFEKEVEEPVVSNVQPVNTYQPVNIIGYNPQTGEPIYGGMPPKKSKKGIIITIIAILVLLVGAGLTTWLIMNNNSSDADEPETEEKDNKKNNKKDNDSEWEYMYEYSEDALEDGKYEGNITEKYNIEKTVILDEKDILITAIRIRYKYDEPDIMVVVENNSKKDIIVFVDNLSINDIMVNSIAAVSVSSGKKALSTISIMDDGLVEADITAIESIEFDLKVDDASYNELFTKTNIKLQTDAKDYEQEYSENKELLMDQKGIKIYAVGVDNEIDDIWGRRMNFYVENDNDFAVTIQMNKCSINGTDVGYSASMSADIPAHKKDYIQASISESSIEKYNLDEIKEADFIFDIYKNIRDDAYIVSDTIHYDYTK